MKIDITEPRTHVRGRPLCGICKKTFRSWRLRYRHAPECRGSDASIRQPVRSVG